MTPTPSAREPQDHIADAGKMVEPQVIANLRYKVQTGELLPLREQYYRYILAAYDALAAEREALARERDSLRTVLLASPDEMTVEFCKLVECLKEEMADKRELLHRLNTDPDTTKALLLKSDQLLFAAERERDALRGVVPNAVTVQARKTLEDQVRDFLRFMQRSHYSQVEIDREVMYLTAALSQVDAARALDQEARG